VLDTKCEKSKITIFSVDEKLLAGLLGVILSGKSASVRMRSKSSRKPVVGQSEVMVPTRSA